MGTSTFTLFSIHYINHQAGWCYQSICDFTSKKLIPTLKLYQSKTSTLNLTCFVETKIPVQAFIRIKYYLIIIIIIIIIIIKLLI